MTADCELRLLLGRLKGQTELGRYKCRSHARSGLLAFHEEAVLHVGRSMAMHRDQHKVVDCSVVEQSAADNLATIVNGDGEHGIQVPVGASRKECG